MADLKKTLKEDTIQSLRRRPLLCFSASSSVQEVLRRMKETRTGCATITQGKKILGIFTERDALTRVVESKTDPSTPIEKLMTPNPKGLKPGDSVADAIRLMNQGGYRHLPLVNSEGEVEGIVSVRDILDYLAEHFPYEIYNLPPDPHQINQAREGA